MCFSFFIWKMDLAFCIAVIATVVNFPWIWHFLLQMDCIFSDLWPQKIYSPIWWVVCVVMCQGCDRSSQQKHALRHYQSHHLTHQVALNLSSLAVWYVLCSLDDSFQNAYHLAVGLASSSVTVIIMSQIWRLLTSVILPHRHFAVVSFQTCYLQLPSC